MELDIGSTLNSEVLVLVLVDVKVLPGKEELHPPDKVPESKPPLVLTLLTLTYTDRHPLATDHFLQE